MPLQSSQKSSGKIVLVETEISLQLKYSVSRPVVVACQKDSGTTVEKWTQVKPVVLTAIIFAVKWMIQIGGLYMKILSQQYSAMLINAQQCSVMLSNAQ